MRLGVIAVTTMVLALMLGLALLAPLRHDEDRARASLPDTTFTRFAHQARFGYQQRLVELRREPLEWDCVEGSPDRARFYRASCAAEHVADFQFFGTSAIVVLHSGGGADFHSTDGAVPDGTHSLTEKEGIAARDFLLERLPKLPGQVDGMQMPAYTSAIEACLGGKPYLALRNVYSRDGDKFESVADELLARAGLEATFHATARCL